MAFDIGYS